MTDIAESSLDREPPRAGPTPSPAEEVEVVAEPPENVRPVAERFFRDRLGLAVEYARLLSTDGVVRGLIGPREAPRIWDRHLFNCAAVGELIGPGSSVVDVGSGAGLPGLVLAVARPDLHITLVESLARRTAFLAEAVRVLGLCHVEVVRARAEECVDRRGASRFGPADVVTARAVTSLDRLAAWCLPLVATGGRLLALKGDAAAAEIEAHRDTVIRLGGAMPTVRRCGVGVLTPPTTVVEIVRERGPVERTSETRRAETRRSGSRRRSNR